MTSSSESLPPATGVDIVVPIYNARRDVERCVESVLRHAAGDWRLRLVDDASTDEELASFLRRTAEDHPRVELLRNERNAGFVVTANRGMRSAGGRDVILLNSDTVVTRGFIEKLAACTYADERTGIVSPFTNNGTICSIPEFCRDNELPADISIDEYGELVSRISQHRRPELVTAVGFCMYVRAEVLGRIGYFDEEHFGRGFGEENDFCERAKAAGYSIRLCDDLFIAHTGKASFGDEGRELERLNSKTMDWLHPRYFAEVAEFCRRNPLRELQANVRYHLARRRGRRYPAMMFVLHASVFGETMGGTEHLVRDLVERLELPRALIVFPESGEIVAAEVFDGRVPEAMIHRFPAGCDRPFFERRNEATEAVLGRIVDLFDVGAVHLHHLIRWPIGLWRELQSRRIPYAFTIHDYYCVCPSWNLSNRRTGRRCECPDDGDAAIGECISAQYAALDLPAPADATALRHEHRLEFGRLLGEAEVIIAPSRAAYEIVRRRYDALPASVHVIGHGYDAPPRPSGEASDTDVPPRADPVRRPGPVRVALLGQVAYPSKGAAAYLELLERTRLLPIEWHVFGDVEVYGYRRSLERLRLGDRLHVHGAYRREKICERLRACAIDVTLLLPTCDETFCFTLSESWLAGVPAIVSNAGALPERVRESGAGIVVGDTGEAMAVLRRLAGDRGEVTSLQAKASAFRHPSTADNAEAHRQAYGRLLARVETRRSDREIGDEACELFGVYDRTRQAAAGGAASPEPSYHSSWWYPAYLRVRRFVPPSWRGYAKRVYLRVGQSSVRGNRVR